MYTFEQEQIINKKLADIFPFFTRPENLALLTPIWLKFNIRDKSSDDMKQGAEFKYTIKFYGIPMYWKTNITKFEPPYLFVDEQLKGPYKKWVHTHTFEEKGNTTIIRDKVEYDLYGWFLKPIIHELFVKKSIQKIFEYRNTVLREYFEQN
jgi:ligand-binding SRPBCC domain-containing protein